MRVLLPALECGCCCCQTTAYDCPATAVHKLALLACIVPPACSAEPRTPILLPADSPVVPLQAAQVSGGVRAAERRPHPLAHRARVPALLRPAAPAPGHLAARSAGKWQGLDCARNVQLAWHASACMCELCWLPAVAKATWKSIDFSKQLRRINMSFTCFPCRCGWRGCWTSWACATSQTPKWAALAASAASLAASADGELRGEGPRLTPVTLEVWWREGRRCAACVEGVVAARRGSAATDGRVPGRSIDRVEAGGGFLTHGLQPLLQRHHWDGTGDGPFHPCAG